jgi:hypothetical protein
VRRSGGLRDLDLAGPLRLEYDGPKKTLIIRLERAPADAPPLAICPLVDEEDDSE